jgi:hypothetical protein
MQISSVNIGSVQSDNIDADMDMGPQTAASQVRDLLNLSKAEEEILLFELLSTSEDPILALKLNPAWVARYGAGAESAVLDEISGFGMPAEAMRDEKSPRFLYHFTNSFQLQKCRASVLRNHGIAFALSPVALTRIESAAEALVPLEMREPLAFTAVVRKVTVHENDVQSFQFFYL